MLTTVKSIACAWAIVAGFSLSVVAQADPNASFEFDKIEVGEETGWEFKSENEPISVQDDLKDIQEYSLSDSEDNDVQLLREERRWGNRGDVRDYSIETEVYGY